jgi:hypothetical protein
MSFSPTRFKYLLLSRLQENKRKYTWFAGLLFLSYLLVFVVFFSTVNEFLEYHYQTKNALPNEFQRQGDNEWNDFVPGLFWAGLFISSILFAAASYVNFSNPGEGIFYLTRPASNLEKWLGEVLIHTLGFLLVYLACYSFFAGFGTWITDLIAESEFRALLNGKNFILREYSQEVHLNPSRVESEFYLPFRKALIGSDFEAYFIEYWACTLFLFGVGFCQLGAVFFNRFSFFKTLFTAAVLGLAFGLLMIFTWKLLIPEDWWFGGTHVTNSDYNQTTRLSDPYLGLLYTLSPIVFVLWIYACGFLAVKEKRV